MVDYNKIAKWFSNSRKNMKWEEMDYFFSFLVWKKNISILDIWCGSGRLLEQFSNSFDIDNLNYLWLDLSDEMLKHAKENFPKKSFFKLDMLNIDKLKSVKFDYIFFVASFHHLENLENRLEVLKNVKELLNDDGKIFFTNWSLNSKINNDKYEKDLVKNSKNKFWSTDYKINFWEYARYYHCFNLKELEYLFKESDFEIIENRGFDNKKNIISIIKKR